jgi:mono/diheme cytochrome c family protein
MFGSNTRPLPFVLVLLPFLCGWDDAYGQEGAKGQEASAAEVDYQKDIAPLLAEHCTHCHGVDEASRQGGLRLDQRDDALRGGDSGKHAIALEDVDQSEILRRILSTDPDEVMPPPSEKKPVSADGVAKLKEWIRQGAPYASHWSFTPPTKKPLPGKPDEGPIDSFVNHQLRSKNLVAAPQASKEELVRRVYLDLIGLPPSPEELDEAVKSPLESTVDKLLQSERFGEKWGRLWLDLARYSDTNGYEKDLQREQWMYRDWVIDAFNRDMPYDRFVIEQIAGDLLPNPTQTQMIATGFLRNSMINEEGAIVPEQFRMVEMFDRIDCVGKSILGLTTQCAQCHTHKFDPITHHEYFGMFAYLNNSYEAQSWVYTEEQQEEIANIKQKLDEIDAKVREKHPAWQTELGQWREDWVSKQAAWRFPSFHQLESISGLNHPTQEPDHSILMKGHTSGDIFFVSKPEAQKITGLRIELLTHLDFPHAGPGRSKLGTWGIHEIELFTKGAEGKEWVKHKLVQPVADFSNEEQKSADGKKATGPVTYLVDGTDDTTWTADRGVGRRNQPSVAVMRLETPIELTAGTEIKIAMRMSDMVGCCRWSFTDASEPTVAPIDYAAQLAMLVQDREWNDVEKSVVFRTWAKTLPEWSELNGEVESLWKKFPVAATSILHLHERPSRDPRITKILDRGNWDQPTVPIEPRVPAAFHPFPKGEPNNRLGFAKWLVAPESPFAARVAVNRVWQALFGEGLLETPDDFGVRAPLPEYRDLLDWLAVDFMEHGWSHKKLIRQIILSETYQRSSKGSGPAREDDPRNRWLARGPRFRADAEVVRDIALSVSGLIHNKMGGPSVIPPVPQSVLDYNYTYPSYWKAAEGPERYRRTVYGFRKRSMPDPVASTLDAPNGDLSCARRVRSNTPLAALTGLNETIFVEAARALALRILREGGESDRQRIERAFLLCISRLPSSEESRVVEQLLESQRKRLADGWINAKEIATGDAAIAPALPPNTTPQDAAAWTVVSRVLLNLDETITKN